MEFVEGGIHRAPLTLVVTRKEDSEKFGFEKLSPFGSNCELLANGHLGLEDNVLM